MNRLICARFSLLVFCGFALVACQGGGDDLAGSETSGSAKTVHSKPAMPADKPKTSPGIPSAPINIDYEIMGKPVVGIPLSINVKVTSALDEPITVNYRFNDTTSLMFSDVLAETVSLVPIGVEAFS